MEIPGTNQLSEHRRRGRAALGNPDVRYFSHGREFVDDGWTPQDDLPPLRTEVRFERPRQVITRNTSPDLSFDRSINPYRGCEHGCIYCYARPSHAFLDLSPGLDFETKLIARPMAPEILARELARKSYHPKVIAIGTNTDPYQPVEKDLCIMRALLEVLEAHRHPVTIVTKGTLIERDLDILSRMARQGLARVGISVTSLDASLSRKMEPRAPSPARRLRTIERLTAAGVPVRVLASPMIPGLTDHEMESILQAGARAGATAARYILVRLAQEVAGLFYDWLAAHYPNRARKVRALVRDSHGGKDYDSQWAKRMTGEGVYAELLMQRFKITAARLGLSREEAMLRTDLFSVPERVGDQMSLF